MIDLNDDELSALESGTQKIGIFIRLATVADPVRVWLGVGAIDVGVNAKDEAGATYQGLGEIPAVPALNQLINAVAERVDFVASGVSTRAASLAAKSYADVVGKECAVGFGLFGADWRQLGVPKWHWRGTADVLKYSQVADEGGGFRSTIALSVGSLFVGRRRRGLSYLTNQDQQLRHPGDLMCERTALYENGVTKTWPVFT